MLSAGGRPACYFILAGCLIAAIIYFPLFGALTHYANPDLEAFAQKNPIAVTADPAT